MKAHMIFSSIVVVVFLLNNFLVFSQVIRPSTGELLVDYAILAVLGNFYIWIRRRFKESEEIQTPKKEY